MRPEPGTAPKKKPYQAPKLSIYGSLSEMTKTRGLTSQLDGGQQLTMRRTGT